jgi:hypothetical protein
MLQHIRGEKKCYAGHTIMFIQQRPKIILLTFLTVCFQFLISNCVQCMISVLQTQCSIPGQLAATTITRESCWRNWEAYIAPLVMDHYLQDVNFTTKSRVLSADLHNE